MKKKTLFILSLAALFLFSACTKRSEKTIDEFFEAYNSEDYSTIKDMSYDGSGELLVELVKNAKDQIGEIEEFKKYEFESKMDGAVKTVTLYYECKASEAEKTIYFKFELIEADGNDPKIKAVLYSQNKGFIDDYNDNREKALDEINTYYKLIKKDDSDAVYDMLSETLTEDDEMVEMFFSLIDSRRSYYGTIETVDYSHTKSEFYDGKTYFYFYYECETEEGNTFYEEITFVEEGSTFKISDYKYAGTLDDLKEV